MCDEDEVWQVARHHRRRHRPGSESSKPKMRCRAKQQLSHTTPSATTNNNTSRTTRGADRGRNSPASSGYSYSTRAGRQPSRQQEQPGQQHQEDRDELVRIELQKLQQLKSLLMQTALWQRLVEGLEYILPQLGLAFPPPDKASIQEPVSVELPLQSGQIPADTTLRGEALLEGRRGDAAEAGCSSRIAEAVRSGGSSEEAGDRCSGTDVEGAAPGRTGAAATEEGGLTVAVAVAAAAGAGGRPTPAPAPAATATVAAAATTTTK